ncbi:MAG: hypothetical protein FWF54_07155, partial [Candidatus Azobacteroides sp.]|nr:hypothetical protein [Candidatus Azobacteroides sp.]
MKKKINTLLIGLAWASFLFTAGAQDYYYQPEKDEPQVTKKEVTKAPEKQPQIVVTSNKPMTVSVDEYNRVYRNNDEPDTIAYNDDEYTSDEDNYQYSDRIDRFHNVNSVVITGSDDINVYVPENNWNVYINGRYNYGSPYYYGWGGLYGGWSFGWGWNVWCDPYWAWNWSWDWGWPGYSWGWYGGYYPYYSGYWGGGYYSSYYGGHHYAPYAYYSNGRRGYSPAGGRSTRYDSGNDYYTAGTRTRSDVRSGNTYSSGRTGTTMRSSASDNGTTGRTSSGRTVRSGEYTYDPTTGKVVYNSRSSSSGIEKMTRSTGTQGRTHSDDNITDRTNRTSVDNSTDSSNPSSG